MNKKSKRVSHISMPRVQKFTLRNDALIAGMCGKGSIHANGARICLRTSSGKRTKVNVGNASRKKVHVQLTVLKGEMKERGMANNRIPVSEVKVRERTNDNQT